MELTDAQWELLKPLVEPTTPRKRRGRPWRDTRQVVEGGRWILRTGAPWAELPTKSEQCRPVSSSRLSDDDA